MPFLKGLCLLLIPRESDHVSAEFRRETTGARWRRVVLKGLASHALCSQLLIAPGTVVSLLARFV